MKQYKIYSEGFSCTGQNGGVTFHGSVTANSFETACKQLAQADADFSKYFDARRLTYWGCRLFPTRQQAAKSFGV